MKTYRLKMIQKIYIESYDIEANSEQDSCSKFQTMQEIYSLDETDATLKSVEVIE